MAGKDLSMARIGIPSLLVLLVTLVPAGAHAVSSAEVYPSAPYGYGRFEARLRFAAGDGVVSSFFLWKDGSEVSGTFWNELDFEKLNADCHVETNAIYGNPPSNNNEVATISGDPCGGYHVYAYEWTPDAIAWLVDGVEVRRDTGAAATAFADNASSAGMQLRFNIWPGDATFGGNFNPNILPVHEYIDWVQFSSYENGVFTLDWREDFNSGTLPAGWLSGNWGSPKNLSTHDPRNVNIIDGYLVLSLTADNATGPAGAMPNDTGGSGGAGMAGTNAGGSSGAMSAGGAGGMSAGGASSGGASSGGASSGGASGTSSSGNGGAAGAVTGGATGAGGAGAGGDAGMSAGGTSGAGASSSGNAGTGSGNAGAGGATAAGGSGASGVPNTGATAGMSGGAGAAGASVSAPDDETKDSGGCTCSSARGSSGHAFGSVLGLALLAAIGRRRRARGDRAPTPGRPRYDRRRSSGS